MRRADGRPRIAVWYLYNPMSRNLGEIAHRRPRHTSSDLRRVAHPEISTVRTGYLDEAFDDQIYVLACVIDDRSRGAALSDALRCLLAKGQRVLHFTKEGTKRRLLLAEAYGEIGLPAVAVVRRGTGRAERRRGLALIHLAYLVEELVDELVIEARQEKLNQHDHAVLSTAAHRPAAWTFEPAAGHELLWAADIVAGAVFSAVARDVAGYRDAVGASLAIHEQEQ